MNTMKKKFRTGQALVELAIVMPFLVMIFIGIIDGARAFHCWSSINHMCVEAARVASQRKNFRVIPNFFGPDTHNSTASALLAFNRFRSPLTPAELTTGPIFEGIGSSTKTVTVKCTFQFTPWCPGLSTLFGGTGENGAIILSAEAKQRKE